MLTICKVLCTRHYLLHYLLSLEYYLSSLQQSYEVNDQKMYLLLQLQLLAPQRFLNLYLWAQSFSQFPSPHVCLDDRKPSIPSNTTCQMLNLSTPPAPTKSAPPCHQLPYFYGMCLILMKCYPSPRQDFSFSLSLSNHSVQVCNVSLHLDALFSIPTALRLHNHWADRSLYILGCRHQPNAPWCMEMIAQLVRTLSHSFSLLGPSVPLALALRSPDDENRAVPGDFQPALPSCPHTAHRHILLCLLAKTRRDVPVVGGVVPTKRSIS